MGKGCKVVVCGQAAVGKTAILEQLLYGNHTVGEYETWNSKISLGYFSLSCPFLLSGLLSRQPDLRTN